MTTELNISAATALMTPSCVRPLSAICTTTHAINVRAICSKHKKNWYKFVAERPDDDMYIPTGVGKFFGYLKLHKPNNHFNENNVFEFRTNYTRI